jgi:outer membrane murein-binding lipoprotein Lpp
MKTTHVLFTAIVLPIVLAGCQSNAGRDRVATDRYSSAQHERTMTRDMNLEREGYTGAKGASRADSAALRETLATEGHRSGRSTNAVDATTNEMRPDRALPQPGSEMTSQTTPVAPAAVEERTIVIIPAETPGIEPMPQETMRQPERSTGEVTLRRDGDLPPGTETARIEDISRYEPDFRRNYDTNYANSGYGYDQFRPAYYFGYELATDPRYRGQEWNTVESDAHGYWNESTMGPWDRYKEAVHYAWDRVKHEKG